MSERESRWDNEPLPPDYPSSQKVIDAIDKEAKRIGTEYDKMQAYRGRVVDNMIMNGWAGWREEVKEDTAEWDKKCLEASIAIGEQIALKQTPNLTICPCWYGIICKLHNITIPNDREEGESKGPNFFIGLGETVPKWTGITPDEFRASGITILDESSLCDNLLPTDDKEEV